LRNWRNGRRDSMTNLITINPSAGSGYTLPLAVDLRPTPRVFEGTFGVPERLAPFGC